MDGIEGGVIHIIYNIIRRNAREKWGNWLQRMENLDFRKENGEITEEKGEKIPPLQRGVGFGESRKGLTTDLQYLIMPQPSPGCRGQGRPRL